MADSIVFNEDCMSVMGRYDDNYFDLAVVDPPYGIGRDGKVKSTSSHGGHKGYEFKGWDNAIPSNSYFKELFRVSKNQIIWGANYFNQYLPSSSGWILWDKGQRIDQADGELAFTSFKKPLRVFTLNRVAIQTDGAIHPTQKPIKLYDFCYKYAKAESGMNILDTHLGSGSNRISADKNNLNFVGCEIDKDYFEAQERRFKDFISQIRLF